MKTFVFFYDRYKTATTSIELRKEGIDHYVLTHSIDHSEMFKKGGTIAGVEITTGNPKGIARQRNFALKSLKDGEWACFMSDDFLKIKSMEKDIILSRKSEINVTIQNQNEHRLKNNISLSEFFGLFPALTTAAEKNGINLIGFGLTDNPLNLKNKFSTKGLVDGRVTLVRKTQISYDENINALDDYMFTAENIIRFGRVLVLNWSVPIFSRFTSGGLGDREERTPQMIKECGLLVEKYYPILQYAEKAGCAKGSHIRFSCTPKNVQEARRRNR